MGGRVVILGGTGFVGRAVADALRSRGAEVVATGAASLNLTAADAPARLRAAVDEETVLVAAARARPADALDNFAGDVSMAMTLARCLATCMVRRCVYFSTTSVYNDHVTDLAISEQTPIAPTSLYGVAKYAGERLVQEAASEGGVPVVILRPCKVYGPGDVATTYGPMQWIHTILREGRVEIYGDGTELRDLIYIGDVADLAARFALGDYHGVYNLVTGHSRAFVEVLEILRQVTDRPFTVMSMARTKPKIDQGFDRSRLLRAMPGFRFTTLEEGLQETYRWATAGERRQPAWPKST